MAKRPPQRPSDPRPSGSRSSRPGVRGPGGPPDRVTGAAPARPAGPKPLTPPASVERSPRRRAFEARSATLLLALNRVPRWLVVVVMALVLFGGLVMPPALGWLGCIMLLVVATFLGWLLALSWPVIGPAARWLRVIVVAALVAIAFYKAVGRF